MIGVHWFGHHRTFRYVTALGGGLARWNMLWLLMLVLTPFATRVLTGDGAFIVRFTCYAVVQVLAGLFFLLMAVAMDRQKLLRPDTPPTLLPTVYWRVGTLIGAFTVSIPIAFVTRWAYVCWGATPLVMRLRQVIVKRRTAGAVRTG